MQGLLRGRTPVTGDRGNEPDEEIAHLVRRARLGDADAFSQLYRRFVARVYDYAARRLRDAHAAEEATQEVFYRAFRGLAGCRDDAAFAGWLFGIARFVVVDHLRARQKASAPLASAFDPEDPAPLPDEAALSAERHDELLAARETCLSPAERELFDLLLADLTDKEIAAALGRRHGAVRTAHWRLLAKLRICFGMPPQQRGVPHVVS